METVCLVDCFHSLLTLSQDTQPLSQDPQPQIDVVYLGETVVCYPYGYNMSLPSKLERSIDVEVSIGKSSDIACNLTKYFKLHVYVFIYYPF